MEKIILLLTLCVQPSFHYHPGHAVPPLDSGHPMHVVRHLPIGQRVDGFLPMDKMARYYFTLNESFSSVTVRVTPCESPLFWALYVINTHDFSFLLKDGYKHHEHQWLPNFGPQRLFSFQGNGEESFSTTMSSGGFYFIDFVSLESDTNFQVFVWDNTDRDNPWPQLPTDPRVNVVSAEESSVVLSWKASIGPSEASQHLEYCVFVNRLYNVKTLCATEPKAKKPLENYWDPQDDHPNKFLKTAKERSRIRDSPKIYKNAKELTVEGNGNNEIWFSKGFVGGQKVCVGNWTNATVSGLKARTLYYFDVFAVNPKHATSVSYTGTFTETKAKHRSLIPRLPSEEMVNIFLKSRGVKILNVEPPARGFKWLYVHSCLHKVHLQITANGNIVVSQSLQGAHNFKLFRNPDKYILTLKSSRGGPGLVKLFTTNAPHHLPFPNLPPDINLSVSNRSCSSATVTWARSGQATKYCIYARHLEQYLDLKLIQKHQNSCLSTNSRSRSEKVLCRHGSPEILGEEQITDLKPGKAYLIDLYFLGLYNTTIKFPSYVVRTQEHCT
ncbi:protein NDNF-like isoform 2-T2 [Pelodytes ibericus]